MSKVNMINVNKVNDQRDLSRINDQREKGE